MRESTNHSRLFRVVGALLFLLTMLIGWFWYTQIHNQPPWAESHFTPPVSPEEKAAEIAEQKRRDAIAAGGEHYKPLKVFLDHPGVNQPELLPISQVDLPDSTPIVGVLHKGTAFAFVVDAMGDPRKHIVNLVIDQTPLTVSYCDLSDCVRVLSNDSSQWIPLKVGGLDIDNELVLSLDGVRYSQTSEDLPLDDLPFERTTFEQWKNAHPDSRIYTEAPDSE